MSGRAMRVASSSLLKVWMMPASLAASGLAEWRVVRASGGEGFTQRGEDLGIVGALGLESGLKEHVITPHDGDAAVSGGEIESEEDG